MSRQTINLTSRKGRALRLELYRKADFGCPECGWRPPSVPPDYAGEYALTEWWPKLIYLAVDHIIPVALGGTDDPSNLRAICSSCNSKKGAKLVVGVPA